MVADMSQSVPPPNWYPDANDPSLVRWWDGRQWTAQVQPVQTTAPHPSSLNRRAAEADSHRPKVGLFGARKAAKSLTDENDQLRHTLQQCGGLELADITLHTSQARDALAAVFRDIKAHEAELDSMKSKIIDVRQAIDVQEFGLYDFEHPAEASAQFGAELSAIRLEIRRCVTAKQATEATSKFMFNNSAAKGRKFINDMSKMLLAAYNAEAENAVKTVKAGGLSTAHARLEKSAERVSKNGQMIELHISSRYHALRMRELELAARHLAAIQAAKLAERAHREELREAKRAEDELRREREKLNKERDHYSNALQALLGRGDEVGAADLRKKLLEIDSAISDVDYRAANVRAGYVYVISNLGSMGNNIVKIGMTRRLDPMDRVRELSDASVPFNFDVHALFFSEDAYGIEAMLHREFADRRVNRINLRREFFYANPNQVLEALQEHKVAIVEFKTDASAEEFRASREFGKARSA